MTSKKNFKKKLCTFALIASFVLSIGTPSMAGQITEHLDVTSPTESIGNEGDEYYKISISSDTGNVLGGALSNESSIGQILTDFTNNSATTSKGSYAGLTFYALGGAISNEGTIGDINTIGIKNAHFKSNFVRNTGAGGNIIYQNTAWGGAIVNFSDSYIYGIENSIFEGNHAETDKDFTSSSGGAIFNQGSITNGITGSEFLGNYAEATGTSLFAQGGAIDNNTNGNITIISKTIFKENKVVCATGSSASAGAISNAKTAAIGSIEDSDFTGNNAEVNSDSGLVRGGAITNYGTITNGIIDSDFTGNFAKATAEGGTAQGGAIYTQKALLIKAENKDVTFRDNYVSAVNPNNAKGSAIYVGDAVALTLQANSGRKITFEDDQTIEGETDLAKKYNVAVKGGGTVEFLQEKAASIYPKESGIYGAGEVTVGDGSADIPTLVISNLDAQTLTFNNGIIDFTKDAKAKAYEFSAVNLTGDGNLKLDVDLAKNEMDSITTPSATNGSGQLHITALTLLTDSAQDETPVPFTSNLNLASATQYDGAEELSTHINKYKVSYDKATGNFIFTKSGASATTEATGDTVNVMNFVWLETVNNLQKRLGDLRGGEASDMAWARFQRSNDDHKGSREFNVSGNLYQVGYDFALKNQVASRGYFGVSLEAFDGTQSYAIGGGDVKSMSLGAYYTKIYDSGHYFDFILRYGRLENDSTSYDATAGLSGILTKLDYAMNSVTLSGEYGYRWNMGNAGLYLEPQAEFIYGYLSGAEATSSTNYLADIDSTNHFVTRLGLAFGQRVKNFNYYLRGSYYHDFAGTIHVKYGGTPYQQDSAQNWWEVSLGGGWNISKLSYFYAELTKHFKDVSNSLNFNVGFRFTL